LQETRQLLSQTRSAKKGQHDQWIELASGMTGKPSGHGGMNVSSLRH
jgi:hypothetical protein